MSGLVFGFGYLMIFIAMFNYLNDTYRQYVAPAHAASSSMRSLFGVCLPFAAPPMYERMGVQWACSSLGFMMLVLSTIPFVFIKYGKKMKNNSPLAKRLLSETSGSDADLGV